MTTIEQRWMQNLFQLTDETKYQLSSRQQLPQNQRLAAIYCFRVKSFVHVLGLLHYLGLLRIASKIATGSVYSEYLKYYYRNYWLAPDTSSSDNI